MSASALRDLAPRAGGPARELRGAVLARRLRARAAAALHHRRAGRGALQERPRVGVRAASEVAYAGRTAAGEASSVGCCCGNEGAALHEHGLEELSGEEHSKTPLTRWDSLSTHCCT